MKKNWWIEAELIARMILGFVFAWAGWLKLRDPLALADSIYSFRMLPDSLINPLALTLPVLELAVGILLLAGVRRSGCARLAGLMCTLFALALAQASARGLVVDCGCFGPGTPTAGKFLWEVARDLGLAVLAGFVVLRAKRAAARQETPDSSP